MSSTQEGYIVARVHCVLVHKAFLQTFFVMSFCRGVVVIVALDVAAFALCGFLCWHLAAFPLITERA